MKIQTEKPENFSEAIQKAGKQFFFGIEDAITGVLVKPAEKVAQADSVGDIFTGVYQGLSGVVVKPISGLFDFFSTTTKQVSTTVANPEEQFNETRSRDRMPLYGDHNYFKRYSKKDAYWYKS
jgi:vacuolar protein sorting-associated protein 13A/C